MRVFPVKAYAFVNYAEIASAIKAMTALEGVALPALTGGCWAAGRHFGGLAAHWAGMLGPILCCCSVWALAEE